MGDTLVERASQWVGSRRYAQDLIDEADGKKHVYTRRWWGAKADTKTREIDRYLAEVIAEEDDAKLP